MTPKKKNHRREERLDAVMPVQLENALGVTRDISASGMFLEMDATYAVGSTIEVALDLMMPWGKALFRCTGKVIRMERRQKRVGIAVQFTDVLPEAAAKPKSPRLRSRSPVAAKK